MVGLRPCGVLCAGGMRERRLFLFAAWERPGSAGSRAALPGPGWRVFLDRPRLGCDVSDRFHVAFVCNITGKNAAVSKGICLSLVWSLLS